MRTILVDDELWMLRQFSDECAGISEIELIGSFRNPEDALAYASVNRVELAFLDINMPKMNGLVLSQKLRERYPDVIIVFVSAYDQYMPEAFGSIDADYFLLKPFAESDIARVMARIRLLSRRLERRVYIRTFGPFDVFINGAPLPFRSAKAKELLALLVDRRGGIVSSREAFTTLWPAKPYNNGNASAYRHVLRKMQDTLNAAGAGDIILPSLHGRALNTERVLCDYYLYLSGDPTAVSQFSGEYMTNYSWGKSTLSALLGNK